MEPSPPSAAVGNPFVPATPNASAIHPPAAAAAAAAAATAAATPFVATAAPPVSPAATVHDCLYLYTAPDTLTLEPVYADPTVPRATLVVARDSGRLRLNAPPSPTLRQEDVSTICGVLGVLRLNLGDVLIVISERLKVGKLDAHDVYRLAGYRTIPIGSSHRRRGGAPSAAASTDALRRDDDTYLRMLDAVLTSCEFYFSYTLDITRSLQNQCRAASSGVHALPLWMRAEPRFYWNKHLQQPLIEFAQQDTSQHVHSFILPVMCGFMTIKPLKINSHPVTLALISRRSALRAGTRFNKRGIDTAGNVANSVETEQILLSPETGHTSSYVQYRGSVPIFWRQVPNLKYQPPLYVDSSPMVHEAFRRHFDDLFGRYGRVIAVNLTNKHGYERRVGEGYAREAARAGDPARLRYIHFDFHRECKNMQWHRISLLLDELRDDFEAQGYFLAERSAAAVTAPARVVRMQASVVRTNCIDCLDRTNVVQCELARASLALQLSAAGLLPAGGGSGGASSPSPSSTTVDAAAVIEATLKEIWADNADAVSKQYSGTGALKTDFTRTGRRSAEGVLQDLLNSVVRYIKNNFVDGRRQDAFDLFLGRFQVDQQTESPFARPVRPAGLVLLLASALLNFCLLVLVLTVGF
ncbi:hypothetical protein HK405_013365, partial [Cladochytrium tenue]